MMLYRGDACSKNERNPKNIRKPETITKTEGKDGICVFTGHSSVYLRSHRASRDTAEAGAQAFQIML